MNSSGYITIIILFICINFPVINYGQNKEKSITLDSVQVKPLEKSITTNSIFKADSINQYQIISNNYKKMFYDYIDRSLLNTLSEKEIAAFQRNKESLMKLLTEEYEKQKNDTWSTIYSYLWNAKVIAAFILAVIHIIKYF